MSLRGGIHSQLPEGWIALGYGRLPWGRTCLGLEVGLKRALAAGWAY